MIFVEQTVENGRVTYRDTKRWWWLLSVMTPGLPGLAALMLLSGAHPSWSAVPLVFYFGLVPLLDWIIGEDIDNPPEDIIEQLAADQWYRALLFLTIPVLYASSALAFAAILWAGLPLWANVLIAVSAGVSAGGGLTVAHELGHKPARLDQFGAKLILALTGYAHFCIEHNKGHHSQVATPEDPASSRLGESVYAFALRELPGAARRGWQAERKRLSVKGSGFWHWRNDLLQGYGLAALMAAALTAIGGLAILPFLLIHHGVGWLQLTLANYVEHYGLLRPKLANGRYAPCEPHHSWNTNHILSNLMLFHLQRHSDHHANPMRPYQTLRNFEDLPRLPSGYPGSFALAVMPPLWRRVMDPKVMAWAQGDISRTNHVPGYTPRV
ncbi:MAG: alkane 1-monooxygenase [Rhizobiaceae bacterium]|nr:alkane 1-monooxygenase [Rhizobiaceae bacterium]